MVVRSHDQWACGGRRGAMMTRKQLVQTELQPLSINDLATRPMLAEAALGDPKPPLSRTREGCGLSNQWGIKWLRIQRAGWRRDGGMSDRLGCTNTACKGGQEEKR